LLTQEMAVRNRPLYTFRLSYWSGRLISYTGNVFRSSTDCPFHDLNSKGNRQRRGRTACRCSLFPRQCTHSVLNPLCEVIHKSVGTSSIFPNIIYYFAVSTRLSCVYAMFWSGSGFSYRGFTSVW